MPKNDLNSPHASTSDAGVGEVAGGEPETEEEDSGAGAECGEGGGGEPGAGAGDTPATQKDR